MDDLKNHFASRLNKICEKSKVEVVQALEKST